MKTIPLPHGYEALVDDADYEALSRYQWIRHLRHNTVYRNRLKGENSKKMCTSPKMHRQILGLLGSGRPIVDHIDGNPLNNQRSNLRICTHSQNNCNRARRSDSTSGYPGVTYMKRIDRWMARVQVNGKRVTLGSFPTKDEAVAARVEGAKRYHGEFARLDNY